MTALEALWEALLTIAAVGLWFSAAYVIWLLFQRRR